MLESWRLAACSILLVHLLLGNNLAERSLVPQNPGSPTMKANYLQESTFKTLEVGELQDETGTRLAFTSFEASDGTKLTSTNHQFDSPARAKEYLERRIVRAQKIVRRDQKRNRSGKVVGDRAEVIYSDVNGASFAGVLWTDGSQFQEITSPSRPMNLKLEKRLTP